MDKNSIHSLFSCKGPWCWAVPDHQNMAKCPGVKREPDVWGKNPPVLVPSKLLLKRVSITTIQSIMYKLSTKLRPKRFSHQLNVQLIVYIWYRCRGSTLPSMLVYNMEIHEIFRNHITWLLLFFFLDKNHKGSILLFAEVTKKLYAVEKSGALGWGNIAEIEYYNFRFVLQKLTYNYNSVVNIENIKKNIRIYNKMVITVQSWTHLIWHWIN